MTRRVLVVEDDNAARAAMELLLSEDAYDVVTAADGAEALRLVTAGPPFDVVLLDLMMPVMDGWSVYWQLRLMPEPHPRIVVLTAADESQFPDGADVVLQKPVEVEQLLAALLPNEDARKSSE